MFCFAVVLSPMLSAISMPPRFRLIGGEAARGSVAKDLVAKDL